MTSTHAHDRPGWLDRVERWGNALPDPVFIFLAFILLAVVLSVIAAGVGWSAVNPVSGKPLQVESLLTEANLRRLLVGMQTTFTGFPPLGLVLVVMLGAAVAEGSGLFTALLSGPIGKVPRWGLTPSVFIIGLLSHHASDAAYVVFIPLAALVYAEAGRHPMAGIATAFAAISGGFAGNVVPGQVDVLLLGITEPAARLIDPHFTMNPLGNWWFSIGICLAFTPVAWFITDRVVEPRLGTWRPDAEAAALVVPRHGLDAAQRRGLRHAGLAALAVVALYAAFALWPDFTPLLDRTADGPQRTTPFYKALIGGFMLLFLATGWAYGRAVGTVKSHRDIVAMMGQGMRTMAPYLVIVFFAAHFVALFNWSNLGPVIAIKGAEALRTLDIPRPLLLVALLLTSSGFDLFIGSASAKWSAMAPVVVPMLMLLGISPEMTTAAYRMGDSVTNILTPLMSNFPLVLVICQRWNRGAGVGSVLALMLPYGLAFLTAGCLLVMGWVAFELPVGPGAAVVYQVPGAAP